MEEHAHMYPMPGDNLSRKRGELTPGIHAAFREFSREVFAAGALDVKTKELIAVAAAHVTQCPYCIRGHTKSALRKGASEQEIMEAVWVAAEMRAGASFAHSLIAMQAIEDGKGIPVPELMPGHIGEAIQEAIPAAEVSQ